MPDAEVRGVTLWAAARGVPRIIVPIMEKTAKAALERAEDLARPRWDGVAELVELRLDLLLAAKEPWCGALKAVKKALGTAQNGAGRPLLATIRTSAEGGAAALAPGEYAAAVQKLLTACAPDLVDIEFSAGPEAVAALLAAAHAAGAKAVFSAHRFDATPPRAGMVSALCAMADAGADIAKLAVMANARADAGELLAATAEAAALRPGTPRLTMAMGPLGTVTRVCGGLFGSCASFGTAAPGKASAPGQPTARALKRALRQLDACL